LIAKVRFSWYRHVLSRPFATTIPLQLLTPIINSFDKGGDIAGAIKNIQYLTPSKRVYAMNAFPDNPRKQLTVYEIGNLGDKGDAGFLVNLLASQQVDALNTQGKPKRKSAKVFKFRTR